MSDQLREDIHNWAEEKLDQWAADVITRCEIADIDPRPILTFNAQYMAAKTVAICTSMPPDQAATLFGKFIERIRGEARQARGK